MGFYGPNKVYVITPNIVICIHQESGLLKENCMHAVHNLKLKAVLQHASIALIKEYLIIQIKTLPFQ